MDSEQMLDLVRQTYPVDPSFECTLRNVLRLGPCRERALEVAHLFGRRTTLETLMKTWNDSYDTEYPFDGSYYEPRLLQFYWDWFISTIFPGRIYADLGIRMSQWTAQFAQGLYPVLGNEYNYPYIDDEDLKTHIYAVSARIKNYEDDSAWFDRHGHAINPAIPLGQMMAVSFYRSMTFSDAIPLFMLAFPTDDIVDHVNQGKHVYNPYYGILRETLVPQFYTPQYHEALGIFFFHHIQRGMEVLNTHPEKRYVTNELYVEETAEVAEEEENTFFCPECGKSPENESDDYCPNNHRIRPKICNNCDNEVGPDEEDYDQCPSCRPKYCATCGDYEVDDDGDICYSCDVAYCATCGQRVVGTDGNSCYTCAPECKHCYTQVNPLSEDTLCEDCKEQYCTLCQEDIRDPNIANGMVCLDCARKERNNAE